MRSSLAWIIVALSPVMSAYVGQATAAEAPQSLSTGSYTITPRNNHELCLLVMGGDRPIPSTRKPYLSQELCPPTNDPGWGEFHFSLTPEYVSGTYSIRAVRVPGLPGQNCATVARQVVFGPASIDVLPCGLGNRIPVDQTVRIRIIQSLQNSAGQTTRTLVRVETLDGQCWTQRDDSRDAGAELIKWACDDTVHGDQIPRGKPSQAFWMVPDEHPAPSPSPSPSPARPRADVPVSKSVAPAILRPHS